MLVDLNRLAYTSCMSLNNVGDDICLLPVDGEVLDVRVFDDGRLFEVPSLATGSSYLPDSMNTDLCSPSLTDRYRVHTSFSYTYTLPHSQGIL